MLFPTGLLKCTPSYTVFSFLSLPNFSVHQSEKIVPCKVRVTIVIAYTGLWAPYVSELIGPEKSHRMSHMDLHTQKYGVFPSAKWSNGATKLLFCYTWEDIK